MNENERLLRAALDRAYPAPAGAPDWDEVLRRLPPGGGAGSHRVRGMLAAAAVAAVAGEVVVAAPWHGSPGFADRALAALGSGRYVTAVVRPAVSHASVVDLATGRERRSVVKEVYRYDSRTSGYVVSRYVDGALTGVDEVAPGSGTPEPGLAAFLGGYREALRNGSAHVVGHIDFGGRRTEVLRFDASTSDSSPPGAGFHAAYGIRIPGGTEDVAVDASTYRPLWYRFSSTLPDGRRERGPVYTIEAIGSSPVTARPRDPGRTGRSIPVGPLTLAGAAAALGRPALVPSVSGLRLRSIELERVTTSIPPYLTPAVSRDAGVHLVYASGSTRLDVEEAPTPQGGYGFTSARLAATGRVPPPGSMRLACDRCGVANVPRRFLPVWTGQLRGGGLYVTLASTDRRALVAAARSLAPVR